MAGKRVLVLVGIISMICVLEFLGASAQAQGTAVTPPVGSIERKAILDALRGEMQKLHGINAVFTVRYLKVLNGWAWIETSPRSADGANQYEEVSALLRKSGAKWKVAELACSEEDNEECLGSPDYFKGLKKRFPKMPTRILPE
jgi:hypothetical protein